MPDGKAKQRFNVYLRPSLIRRAKHVAVDQAQSLFRLVEEALGLTADATARPGHWVELAASGGELGLHNAAKAADGKGRTGVMLGRTGVMLGLVADEPLEDVAARLRTAGFPPEGEIVDQEWDSRCSSARPTGRCCRSTSRTASSTPEEAPRWQPSASATSSTTSTRRSRSTATGSDSPS